MRRPGAWIWLSLLLAGAPLTAQESSLARVQNLTAQGRVQEARELLLEWWERRAPTASRGDLQRGIWLRGKLTVDPSLAEADFRRLTVEYPGGEHSDDALLRLGLLALSRGEGSEASAHFQSLVRDYPASPLRPRALEWLSEVGVELPSSGGEGRAPAGSNRVEARAAEGQPPGPGLARTLAVQVGAFQELNRARALADEVEGMGYMPRLVRVPGSDLVKVRIGRFSRREAADSLARELRAKGVDCTLSSDAHREVEVGSRQIAARALSIRPLTSSARWPMSSRPAIPS